MGFLASLFAQLVDALVGGLISEVAENVLRALGLVS